MNGTTIIFAVILYSLIFIFYRYSNGKAKVRPEKKQAYENWLKAYGTTARKACITILIIYTIVLVVQLI